jgi:hypothetical protein
MIMSALTRALARIEASVSITTKYEMHKRRVRSIMRFGSHDPEALRYKQIAEQAPHDIQLEAAVIIAARCHGMEVGRRERIERTWGVCHEPRIRLMVLDELRLMLRWCRRYAPAAFAEWRDHLNGEE